MGNLILLNRMYAGDYLNTGTNIGHEIINLYKSDNGNNYIYVNPYGTMAKVRDNKVSAILLVRLINQDTYEILAKAEGLEQLIVGAVPDNQKEINRQQKEYVKRENITYGGVMIDRIFSDNAPKSNKKIPQCVTFKTEKVSRAKETIYITESERFDNGQSKVFLLPEKHLSKQSLKVFYSDIEHRSSFEVLNNMINNQDLWENPDESTFPVRLDEKVLHDDYSFLTLIKKEYDELAYSNLLEYFLNLDSSIFNMFCKEVLGIDDFYGEYEIIREREANIDILIKGSKHVIVIENKIKSGVNGIDRTVKTESEAKNQLKKYYEHVKNKYKNLKPYCFILSPDYNKIDVERYIRDGIYKTILYSHLFNFFNEHKSSKMAGDKYFRDFLAALHKQSRLIDSSAFEVMQERFITAIKKAKNGNVL